ncbi:hypothetical protein ACQEU3_15860 [Spirillospora sp. CA-253888]
MTPEQIAAELDRRQPGWAILFGRYSRQFVALPLIAGRVLASGDPGVLERLIAQRTPPTGDSPHGQGLRATPQ